MSEIIVADIVGSAQGLAAMKEKHHQDLSGGHNYLEIQRNANYVEVDTYLKTLKKVKQQVGIAS